MKTPPTDTERRWDRSVAECTDYVLEAAAACDDAVKAGRLLAERLDRRGNDRLLTLAAVRWRLLGLLDHDPGDLVALAGLGLLALAGAEPDPEVEVRHTAARKLGRSMASRPDADG